jgi:hypothetical protein
LSLHVRGFQASEQNRRIGNALKDVSMAKRVVQTSKQLSAERQIHAAITHFHTGDFECVITLCSAAEGQMPEPSQPAHLLRIIQRHAVEHPAFDGQNDDFNYVATWMKHGSGNDVVEIDEWQAVFWLNRAISKYRAVYGMGTMEMAGLFPWAREAAK